MVKEIAQAGEDATRGLVGATRFPTRTKAKMTMKEKA